MAPRRTPPFTSWSSSLQVSPRCPRGHSYSLRNFALSPSTHGKVVQASLAHSALCLGPAGSQVQKTRILYGVSSPPRLYILKFEMKPWASEWVSPSHFLPGREYVGGGSAGVSNGSPSEPRWVHARGSFSALRPRCHEKALSQETGRAETTPGFPTAAGAA